MKLAVGILAFINSPQKVSSLGLQKIFLDGLCRHRYINVVWELHCNQDLVEYYYLVIETSLVKVGLRCCIVSWDRVRRKIIYKHSKEGCTRANIIVATCIMDFWSSGVKTDSTF